MSVSEVIILVRCLQGSDSASIKTSYTVGKQASDEWQKPLVKVMAYGYLLPKHRALVLLDGLSLQGYDLNAVPPLLYCIALGETVTSTQAGKQIFHRASFL